MEALNGKFRGELLNGEFFYTLKETPIIIERWRQETKMFRPHSAPDYQFRQRTP